MVHRERQISCRETELSKVIDLCMVAQCVQRVKEFDVAERMRLWKLVENKSDPEIEAMRSFDYKTRLAQDKVFARSAGIPYASFTEHWDLIRAGFALYNIERTQT